jgi:hypothetical protein
MKSPNVCTAATTCGRIVSTTFAPAGASSRWIRREEYHFISSVGTHPHLCVRNGYDSKMFTLHSQVLDLTLFNLFYSLSSENSKAVTHSFQIPPVASSHKNRTTPFHHKINPITSTGKTYEEKTAKSHRTPPLPQQSCRPPQRAASESNATTQIEKGVLIQKFGQKTFQYLTEIKPWRDRSTIRLSHCDTFLCQNVPNSGIPLSCPKNVSAKQSGICGSTPSWYIYCMLPLEYAESLRFGWLNRLRHSRRKGNLN